MPEFSTQKRTRHSADEMFGLVADIERYPEFVPLCQALAVRRRIDNGDGTTTLLASMTVGYGAIRETFTSRVTLRPAERAIDVGYVDGPISRMENRWTFRDDGPGASFVGFFISYEFRSRLLAGLMGQMFDRAFRKMSDTFEARVVDGVTTVDRPITPTLSAPRTISVSSRIHGTSRPSA